jgi:hypothetical protein
MLKQLQVHKRNTEFTPTRDSKKRNITEEDDLIDLFPLPRYFQVHFEHIHDNAHDIQSQLDQLKQTLASVEDKLDRFMALLGHDIEPKH